MGRGYVSYINYKCIFFLLVSDDFFLLVSDDSSRIGAMLVTRCVRSLYSGLIEIEISYDCFSTDR